MRQFILIDGEVINRYLIARAKLDGDTLTLNIHGAGQHTYTGDEAKAAYNRLRNEAVANPVSVDAEFTDEPGPAAESYNPAE